jgi:hypothetical protein
LRFVVRAGDSAAGSGTNTTFFVPPVHDALVGVARSLASESPIDKLGILSRSRIRSSFRSCLDRP